MRLPTELDPPKTDRGGASNDLQTAVLLEDITVRYRIPHERITTVKEYTIRFLKREVGYVDCLALQGLNLEVRHGEVFGIIGKNGAGKSTLLKLIARVLQPTKGRVRVKGRVAPLLDISAGFHPELTGRENIFLNGTLLGLARKEISEKFTSIVDFAELWDFIEAPFRMYSSGMIARLGFAVATAVEPDILLIDEVLAVGDEAFRRKCAERMQYFRKQGTTILLVSHDMNTVKQLCQRAVWLNKGKIKLLGPANEVVESYEATERRISSDLKTDPVLGYGKK
jgi:lipopolysaccharide transport system ATP-binding protein